MNYIPKQLEGGKDIDRIIYKKDSVIKHFKNKHVFNKTIYFLTLCKKEDCFPIIINTNKLQIEMSNCGDLLSLYNLPQNWEDQLLHIRDVFKKYNYYILDIRFLPYTPYVINNVCVRANKIYIIDLTLYRKRTDFYINFKIRNLIYKIKIYIFLMRFPIVLFIVHFFFEIIRMLLDLYDILLYHDISIFYEIKYINLFKKKGSY